MSSASGGKFSINRIQHLLEEEFWDVAGYEPFLHPTPASQVFHFIDTANSQPLHSKVRPLSDEKLAAAKEAFAEREAAGVIRRSNSLWASPLHMMFRIVPIMCDIFTGVPRPVVPANFCRRVFTAEHELSHAGTHATRRLIANRWLWYKINHDVNQWCRECTACQVSKVTRHTVLELWEIPVPTRLFTEVNLDLLGPSLPTQGLTSNSLPRLKGRFT